MTADEIRIECLKLAERRDLTPEQVVEHAKVYETYATGNAKAPPKSGRKASGTSHDPFRE